MHQRMFWAMVTGAVLLEQDLQYGRVTAAFRVVAVL